MEEDQAEDVKMALESLLSSSSPSCDTVAGESPRGSGLFSNKDGCKVTMQYVMYYPLHDSEFPVFTLIYLSDSPTCMLFHSGSALTLFMFL